jgi:hypothetical protein
MDIDALDRRVRTIEATIGAIFKRAASAVDGAADAAPEPLDEERLQKAVEKVLAGPLEGIGKYLEEIPELMGEMRAAIADCHAAAAAARPADAPPEQQPQPDQPAPQG